jgi:serine/threonine protein phosphatase PrpC
LSIVAGSGGSSDDDVIATVAVFDSASQNKNVPCFFAVADGMG